MKAIVLTAFLMFLALGGKAAFAASTSPHCGHGDGCYETLADTIHIDDSANVVDSEDATFILDDPYTNIITEGHDVVESYSGLPERIHGHGERVFIFSPRLLKWAAYDAEGYLVASGKANGGSGYCSDLGAPCRTPTGSFRVHGKGTASCVSNKFPLGEGGAPMPYCMYFNGGYAIHGSPYISNRNTSHGCIRVHTAAAAWLHRYFMTPGTKVIVLPY